MIRVMPSRSPLVQKLEDELQAGYLISYGAEDPNPEGGVLGCDLPAGMVQVDMTYEGVRGMVATRFEGQRALSGRLYVRPEYRRRGIARSLLEAQEKMLLTLGMLEVWMETEVTNTPIIDLRTSMGFEPIAPYGFYADNPTSVFLGKRLSQLTDYNEGCER